MAHFRLTQYNQDDPAEMNAHSIMLSIVFYLIFGALLIFLKDKALDICAYVLAGAMVLYGGYLIFAFIGSPVMRKITEYKLAIGLIMLLTGALLAFNTDILDKLFPVFWGLSLLFGGFLKIQYSFAQFALKIKRWWIMLIFAAFSIAIGVLALIRPDFLGDNKEMVIGIMLVAEAVLDFVVFFLMNHAMKKITAYSKGTISLQDIPAPVPQSDD